MLYVASNVELYTMLLAWVVYDIIWEFLSKSGMIFIPFIAMLYQNMHEPHVSQDMRPAATTSFKRMRWDLTVAIIVIVLFGVPFKQLKIDSVQYVSPPTFANPNSTTVSIESDDTGSKNLQAIVDEGVNVPFGWLFVLTLGNGANQYIQGAIPHPDDLRGAALHLRTGYVSDEIINMRISEFSNLCHIPAAAKYRKSPSYFDSLDDNQILQRAESRADDLAWMGSKVLLETPGLYKDCPIEFVKSITDDGKEKIERDLSNCAKGSGYSLIRKNKIVYCNEIWEGSSKKGIQGLRNEIIEYAKTDTAGDDEFSFWDKGIIAVTQLVGDRVEVSLEDILVRSLIESNGEHRTGLSTPDAAYYSTMWTDSAYMRTATNVIKSWDTSGQLRTMSQEAGFMAYMGHTGLPIIKALLLMSFIWFIPLFFMVAGFHDLEKLMQLIVVIFTLQLLTMIWNLGYWVDQTLAYLLYGGSSGVWDYVKGHITGPNRLILDTVSTVFYVILPTLFIMLMTWAGMKIGQLAQATQGAQGQLDSAGKGASSDGALGGMAENAGNKAMGAGKQAAVAAIKAKAKPAALAADIAINSSRMPNGKSA